MIKNKQEECQALINQSFILNGSPFMAHNVINPSESGFTKHPKMQFNIDEPIFDNYFPVSKLNVSINLSFTFLLNLKFLTLMHRC
jgi:hypothetical protein